MRRTAIVTIAIAISVALLRWLVYDPVICNRAHKTLRLRAVENFGRSDDFRTRARVERDAKTALDCAARIPNEIDFYMISAANYRTIGRLAVATDLYKAALRYDRRPEIYINLGEVLLADGRREEGVAALTTAARFYGDEAYIDYIMRESPEREEVKARLRREHLP